MDLKFGLILILSTLLSCEANWSAGAFALVGGFIAVVFFWRFLKRHTVVLVLIIAFTGFLIGVNLVGVSSWLNNITALIAPPIAVFIIQYNSKSVRVN